MSSRHSKIVCTLGPATNSPRMIRRLIEAGMDVARLNFSHGTHETHAHSISNRIPKTHEGVRDSISKSNTEDEIKTQKSVSQSHAG